MDRSDFLFNFSLLTFFLSLFFPSAKTALIAYFGVPTELCSHGVSGGTSCPFIYRSGINLCNLAAERDSERDSDDKITALQVVSSEKFTQKTKNHFFV